MTKREPHASQISLDDECSGHREALNPEAGEVYQFTCSASTGGTTVVCLVRTDTETVLIAREAFRWKPERIWAKQISDKEWEAIQEALRDADFWHLPEEHTQGRLDDASWTLEGRRGDEYHASRCTNPRNRSFFKLSMIFVELAGAALPRGMLR